MKKAKKILTSIMGLAILLFFGTSMAHAYDLDYSLNAYFLVESVDEESGARIPQMWDITMAHGLDDNKERFIDFRLVIFRISHVQSDAYVLRDIEVFESGPAATITFDDNILNAEFGTIKKQYVTLQFNDDGSLKDMSGLRVFTPDPQAKITYRLVNEPQEIQLIMPNNWPSGRYSFHRR